MGETKSLSPFLWRDLSIESQSLGQDKRLNYYDYLFDFIRIYIVHDYFKEMQ